VVAKTQEQQNKLLTIKAVSEDTVVGIEAKNQKEKKPKAVKAARNPVKDVKDIVLPISSKLVSVSEQNGNSVRNTKACG
jgi:hypothetical protein